MWMETGLSSDGKKSVGKPDKAEMGVEIEEGISESDEVEIRRSRGG